MTTPLIAEIMLFCLVLGDVVENAFVIDIREDKTISHLKKLIKEKKDTFQNVDANDLVLWKISCISINEKNIKIKIRTDIDIEKKLGGMKLFPSDTIRQHFHNLDSKDIRIIILPPTTASLSIESIINAGLKIKKANDRLVTMYKYVERPHIRRFIQDRLQSNIAAFRRGSYRPNDYQGISISGGSGTGKTRLGFEVINMIDLEKIENFDIKTIHIFAQISYYTVDFGKRPELDQTTKRYPHISEHVKLVSQYLALAISTYWFTNNYKLESLSDFKSLAKSSAINLQTVLLAIRYSCQMPEQSKLLILLQLDEYQRDQYLLTVILRFISTLVSDEDIKRLNVLIVPICTGTAPTKIEESGDLSVTDYKIYDIHVSPMDMKASLDFIDSVIEYRTNNFNPISRENLLYQILVGAVRGIAIIMEECAIKIISMKVSFTSAEQVKEIWKMLVDWLKARYTLNDWLDSIGGKKHSEDNEVKRKHAVLNLLFLIHTQKLITKDTALNNSTLGDHEVGGLIFLEAIDSTYYKAKAPLVLIASLVSHLKLDFFDDIVLDPFSRLDEDTFPLFIIKMHLITYRLAEMIGIRSITIKEIYFGYIMASEEILFKAIDIHHVQYKAVPALEVRKNVHKHPFKYNNLTNRKEVLVVADTNSNRTEIIDITTGHYFVMTQKRGKSADALTPHGDEQYKFSAVIASGHSVHKTSIGEIDLEEFKTELEKAYGCECFVLITIKRFLHGVNELPPKTGIVFGDLLLGFMGIYGDLTKFIALP
ncbi:23024_t:CDS:2 [Cetraspora pellucida]|uniref:23024_t:CDS:1 n=1 Tax=Cetraspora pellucida TaxID=1433469 RepID=A0A9N8WL85_9GLOM|nr:23024_t:CDS:2 [Cetraspora pellucida]